MNHTLRILVNNNAGVMSHVSGLFTRRAYNIDSIAVGVTDNPEISSMTIVVKGDDSVVSQVIKQLNKLPDVLEIEDLHNKESISRELVLVQVKVLDGKRQELTSICEVFKANILDITDDSLMLEYSGNSRQVNIFVQMLKKFGILEIARTGLISLKCRK